MTDFKEEKKLLLEKKTIKQDDIEVTLTISKKKDLTEKEQKELEKNIKEFKKTIKKLLKCYSSARKYNESIIDWSLFDK